jgi:hypothetical protein
LQSGRHPRIWPLPLDFPLISAIAVGGVGFSQELKRLRVRLKQ